MADLKTRKSYFVRLQKTLDNVKAHNVNPLTIPQVKVLEKQVSEMFGKAEAAHFKILETCADDAAAKVQEDHLEDINKVYIEILTRLQEIRDTTPSPPSSATRRSLQSQSCPLTTTTVKLPRIELPVFHGTYESWPSFQDLFIATIHKNQQLSDSQRLQYLVSCVKSEAANLISSIAITDANYSEAWTLLETRYSNKREVVNSLINKILNSPIIKHESATAIQQLFNTITECIRQLKVLGRPVDKWDDVLTAIMLSKLDPDTKAEWAKSLTGTDPPTVKEVQDFLERHIRVLLARGTVNSKPPMGQQASFNKQSFKKVSFQSHQVSTTTLNQCGVCSGAHAMHHCQKLSSLPVQERFNTIQKLKACSNCLGGGHTWWKCNRGNCQKCGNKHHTLLHGAKFSNKATTPDNATAKATDQASTSNTQNSALERKQVNHTIQETNQNSQNKNEESNQESNHKYQESNQGCNDFPRTQVLLKTAMVNIQDSKGALHSCRVLLDDGSEATLMKESFANMLGLHKQKTNVLVEGISQTAATQARWKVVATLTSRVHDAKVEVEALLLPRVTGKLPRVPCSTQQWSHLQHLSLADPDCTQPSEVDVLIGADVLGSILREGMRQGPRLSPTAQNTIFGWVLYGKVSTNTARIIQVNHTTCNLDELVQKFWEVERVPVSAPFTQEELTCEKHFTTTHTRSPDGRYVVRLPFNEKINSIGESKEFALRRLQQLEKRFKKHPAQHQAYRDFMREYLELGHMELVPKASSENKSYYIPHHFVIKEDSSTTKLRVVFDASMKSSSGTSLNDALRVGPTVQEDLLTLLMRFRTFKVALKADVAKMYRQFQVHQDDRDYQRILWRDNETEEVQEYRLTTVTYGTACAPFLATRCLNQLALDGQHKFPAAAQALLKQSYVDDHLGGADTPTEAVKLYHELIQLCRTGGLDIRKWTSNSHEVLQQIPEGLHETSTTMNFESNSIKALGVRWQPAEDIFHFNYTYFNSSAKTKRKLLSEIASTYDPVGWISPVTISAKILMQDVWRSDAGWDDPLPERLMTRWQSYCSDLKHITELKIPRYIPQSRIMNQQIHGFCDASEKAYAAAVYLRTIQIDGSISVDLLTSRTKVAPLRQISLPRLELCGAHLLAETIQNVSKVFTNTIPTYAWTDSMVTLQWITSPSRNWKTYVANRVSAIQEVLSPSCWQHVHGEENPADLPSRGISTKDLINNNLWWHGPSWLSSQDFPISSSQYNVEDVIKEERAETLTSNHLYLKENRILGRLEQLSSFEKIISTIAWMKRFCLYLKVKQRNTQPLSVFERESAALTLFKMIQERHFNEEIMRLSRNKMVPVKSKLAKLNPFLDPVGLLRVGGRLHFANVSYDKRFPIILPSDNHSVATLIQFYHHKYLHGGFQLVTSNLKRRFWIIGGRNKVRNLISKCVICRRVKAVQLQQQMGHLPPARIAAPARAFTHTGVDFAGPITIKTRSGRGAKHEKAYMAIFICYATKACHLEAVSSLSTKAFIAAYKRFASRRGVCSFLQSDCGTNFTGADKELRKMLTEHNNQQSIISSECRPLCALTNDMDDVDALTPGHFLIGAPLSALPEPDLTLEKTNRLDRWRRLQQLMQTFWRRWSQEYITGLQERPKWQRRHANLQVGDLVIIRDDCLPPTKWKLGRVTITHKGIDGLVRKATLKTANGELMRPIQKLSILVNSHED